MMRGGTTRAKRNSSRVSKADLAVGVGMGSMFGERGVGRGSGENLVTGREDRQCPPSGCGRCRRSRPRGWCFQRPRKMKYCEVVRPRCPFAVTPAGRAPHHPGAAPARRLQAMPMRYAYTAIADADVPRASFPLAQHLLDTYASESNKVVSVWREFSDADLEYRPHPRASTVGDILKHQLLSERRFFGEFLGAPEPPAGEVLPAGEPAVAAYIDRFVQLAR